MALSKIQPASMDLTANYAFTGTNSIAGLEYAEKKLATVTASSSATLSFTSSIDSTYNIYKFRFVNIHCATDQTNFTFNGSSDTGSNYNVTKTTTFFRAGHNEAGSDSGLEYATGSDLAQSTSFQKLNEELGNDNDQACSGELFLFDPSSTTFVKHFMYVGNASKANNQSINFYIGGYGNTTSAVNAIEFKADSGNVDSGTITMYGVT